VVSDLFCSQSTKPDGFSFSTSVSLAMPYNVSSLRFGLVVKYTFLALEKSSIIVRIPQIKTLYIPFKSSCNDESFEFIDLS